MNISFQKQLDKEQAKKLRRECFQKEIPLHIRLIEIIGDDENNEFLTNPPAQNCYLYLVDYVTTFAARWFGKDVSQINVLDWGCGKGHITFLLKEKSVIVTSADRLDDSDDSAFGQSTPIINQAKIEVVGLEHDYLLPFLDNSFDVVISMGVLEHVPNDLKSLQEIYRVLKKNGLFFCFFLPYQFSWTQQLQHLLGNYYHDRLYTETHIHSLLAKSSFGLIDIWHRQLFPKNRARYKNYHIIRWNVLING